MPIPLSNDIASLYWESRVFHVFNFGNNASHRVTENLIAIEHRRQQCLSGGSCSASYDKTIKGLRQWVTTFLVLLRQLWTVAFFLGPFATIVDSCFLRNFFQVLKKNIKCLSHVTVTPIIMFIPL